jgi:hypothetical protein
MATSITYAGITWNFSADRTVGTRANGEPWVQGPVTITSISPATSIINTDALTGYVQNGAMKNPIPEAENGFTNGLQLHSIGTGINYNSSLNAALSLPLALVAGDILVSCITDPDFNVYGGDGEYGNGFPIWYSMIDVYAALEVLAEPPSEPGFRSGLFGTSRKTFHVSDINWSIFPNLPPVAESPTLAEIQALVPNLCNVEWNGYSSTGPFIGAQNIATGVSDNGPSTYGRDIAQKWSNVALYLCQEPLLGDEAAWEALVIQVIQVGLDAHSYFENGGLMLANGAQKVGRSFPHTLAAHALGDVDMLDAVTNEPSLLPEKSQTIFVVSLADVGRVMNTGDLPRETYTLDHVGLAEWGQSHLFAPDNDDSRINANYRNANWPQMAGTILATRLMGVDFGWVPSLHYTERFATWSGGYTGFTGAMWDEYYSTLPALGPLGPEPATYKFSGISLSDGVKLEEDSEIVIATSSESTDLHYIFIPAGDPDDDPTDTDPLVSTAFSVTESGTLKTRAVRAGEVFEPIASITFTVITDGTPAPPINQTVSTP